MLPLLKTAGGGRQYRCSTGLGQVLNFVEPRFGWVKASMSARWSPYEESFLGGKLRAAIAGHPGCPWRKASRQARRGRPYQRLQQCPGILQRFPGLSPGVLPVFGKEEEEIWGRAAGPETKLSVWEEMVFTQVLTDYLSHNPLQRKARRRVCSCWAQTSSSSCELEQLAAPSILLATCYLSGKRWRRWRENLTAPWHNVWESLGWRYQDLFL